MVTESNSVTFEYQGFFRLGGIDIIEKDYDPHHKRIILGHIQVLCLECPVDIIYGVTTKRSYALLGV